MQRSNFLLLTYDSCRYDVLVEAKTPVLDSFSEILSAQTPANFTYAAHLAFFVGILPNVSDDLAYYNRFTKQLLGLVEVGETNVAKDALVRLESAWNLPFAFQSHGYQTVGAGAMNWFRQETLIQGFDQFRFTGTDADSQIDFLLNTLDSERPFFGFINFGETHAPFSFAGKEGECPVDVRARIMIWPPREVGGWAAPMRHSSTRSSLPSSSTTGCRDYFQVCPTIRSLCSAPTTGNVSAKMAIGDTV